MKHQTDTEDARPSDTTAPTRVAWYTLFLLTLAYTVSMIDRKLPFILADSIKHDLNLTDTQLGLVTGAMFAVVYSTVGIPVAALADHRSRKRMIAWAILIWNAMTVAGGLAQNFWHLALSRIGVAAGESVLSPAAHSMIGDSFAPRYRARAIAIYFLGAQLGSLAGMALGGLINELANWRLAMFLLGGPGIFLTILVALTMKEPPRMGDAETSPREPPPPVRAVLVQLLRQPTLAHLLFASMLANVAAGGLNAFLPSHLLRTFGMGTAQLGITYGLAMGLAGVAGTLLGGFAGDWLRRKSPWKALGFVGIGEAIGVPCIVIAVMLGNYPAALAFLFVSYSMATISTGPTYATLQSLMKSNTHATATAIFLFCISGMGMTIGSLMTGLISDAVSDGSGGTQASLQTALMFLAIPKLWAAGHYLLSAECLRRRDWRFGGPVAQAAVR
jgi:predicted MFS family arabinose efflux permease